MKINSHVNENKVINIHKKWKGKLNYKIICRRAINVKMMPYIYTPGVATICKLINKNESELYSFTNKSNTFAIISNGTAVLGLGNIGASSVVPVLESKSAYLKFFTNINCVPIALNINDKDNFIKTVTALSINYRGIILEDIKSPDCFYITSELRKKLKIPVFHDDQDATAVAILTCMILFIQKKNLSLKDKIVICGLGAAGVRISNLLHLYGFKNIYGYDKKGPYNTNRYNEETWLEKNLKFLIQSKEKNIKNLLEDAKVFIGLSTGGIIKKSDLSLMKDDNIILSLANPIPEIKYNEVDHNKCFFYACGNNTYKNTINNIFVYPTIAILIQNNIINSVSDKILIKIAKNIANYCLMNNSITPKLSKKYFKWVKNNIKIL